MDVDENLGKSLSGAQHKTWKFCEQFLRFFEKKTIPLKLSLQRG